MDDIVIAGAARTAIGNLGGGLSTVPAHYLGETVIREVLGRAKVTAEDIDEVIMGQIYSAGQGQNPARQAAVNAGIPIDRTAFGINQLCGSGLRSVALAYQALRLGDAHIMVAGGQESMSQAPHVAHLRSGHKLGNVELTDSMLKDGLLDAFYGYHMGNTAENIAREWQLTREEQDNFALRSQAK
ncbi:MAG: beta-ketoacyl synthase N-terminal-like domain-containing protein, partial [Alphaproteobacteria bacterium]